MIGRLFKKICIGIIRLYQIFISPYKIPTCRFLPTCSEYCKDAFIEHNFFYALNLSLKRLFRCHIFSKQKVDLVPRKINKGKHEI